MVLLIAVLLLRSISSSLAAVRVTAPPGQAVVGRVSAAARPRPSLFPPSDPR